MDYFVTNKTAKNFQSRRKWMFLVLYTVAFMIGSENAIIYPTAWKYIQELGIHDESTLGWVISAFSISGLVSGVALGVLADRRGRSRSIMLTFNLCSVLGNSMYFVGGNAWMLIGGRLVAGIGGGIVSVFLAELAKATRLAERTKAIAIVFGARQVGIALGPAYNLVIGGASFDLGFLVVSETNFPGFLMALIWVVYEILFFLSYFDAGIEMQSILRQEAARRGRDSEMSLPKTQQQSKSPVLDAPKPCDSQPKSFDSRRKAARANETDVDDEMEPLLFQDARNYLSTRKAPPILLSAERLHNQESSSLIRRYIDCFVSDTVIPLLFIQFLAFFVQNVLETTIPPANEFYFGFGSRTNSFVYLAIGLESILVYVAFYFVVDYVSERVMLVASCSLMILGNAFSLVVSFYLEEGNTQGFPLYMMGCALIFLAVPLTCMTTMTIFSKALPSNVQGAAQGIRRVCNYLGLILGPLFGGGLVFNGAALYSVPMFMSMVALVLSAASYQRYRNFGETS